MESSSSSAAAAATAWPHPHAAVGLLSAPLRSITLGMVALISLFAFEHLAVAAVMPIVARSLAAEGSYALAFGAEIAASIVGLVAAGAWSDRRGPQPPLWWGVALFVAGVAGAGLASSMAMLVAARALQGLGGGLVSVALYVLVGHVYPKALHPKMFAAFAAAWVLPVLVGPLVVGLVTDHFGWRWVFGAAVLVALPAALALASGLAAGIAAARRSGSGWTGDVPDAAPGAGRPSLIAAVACALGAAALYGAASPAQSAGSTSGLARAGGSLAGVSLAGVSLVGVVLAGVLALILFVPRLLPPGTLRAARGLPTVVALRGLAAAAFFGGEVFMPLMLVQQRGASATEAGWALTVGALGWSAGSWLQARARDRAGMADRVRRLRIGLLALALGIAITALVLWPATPTAAVAAGWLIAGLGIGLVFPTLSVLTLALSAPAEQGANASALQLSDALVSALGLALAGALQSAFAVHSAPAGFAAVWVVTAAMALAGAALCGRVGATDNREPAPAAIL
jgi:MFS family permease